MMRFKTLIVTVLFFGLSAAALAAAETTSSSLAPDKVVQQTASQMLKAVAKDRVELKKHPGKLYDLIGKILLPHFDLGFASQLVLGPYWRTATPQERQEFQTAFYKFLVHSYANGLLQGNFSDRNLEVQPWRGDADATHAIVRSKVLRADGPPVQVDYAMVHTKDGWKAFDVSIEGISYVMNYRNQFAPEIQQRGIEELIKRLEASAEKTSSSTTHKNGA